MAFGTGRTITLVIDPLGKPKLEGHGFQGTECDAAMKPIEDALAGDVAMQKEYKQDWATGTTEQSETVPQW